MNIPKWLHQVIYEKKFRVIKHLLFWLFIYSDEVLSLFGLTEPLGIPFLDVIFSLVLDMILVYVNIYYLIPKLFLKGKVLLYISLTFLSLLFVILINYNVEITYWSEDYAEEVIYKEHEEFSDGDFPQEDQEFIDDYYNEEIDFFTYLIAALVVNAGMLFIAVAMKLLEKSYISYRQIQELKEENLKTELAYLKTQVNPHFLFNTLNNMYVMSRKQDKNMPDTIMQLSDLLRYQLYECEADTVPLKNEINYINNYIDLEQLRTQNLEVDMQIKGDPLVVQIRPLIFLPFIENAFKYSKTDGGNDFIKITFDVSANSLHFICRNNIGTLKSGVVGGIGLTNATRRLELSYPQRHTSNINESNGIFEVDVKIDLS